MSKHFIFDFDGVLVDSMDTWAGVYVNLLRSYTGDAPSDMVKQITPLGNAGAARYCIERGVDMTEEQLLEYSLSEFQREYLTNVRLKPNVATVLRKMKESGISLHVLTASSHSYVDGCLDNAGVLELFTRVWSTDDFGLSKAAPDIYLRAAELLGADVSDCTFFDDNIIALTNAKLSGMRAVGVYDKSSDALVDDIKAIGDSYIYNFSEIRF